jgi:hypothetical protein
MSGSERAIETMITRTAWLSAGASRQRISLLFGWLAEVMIDQERFDDAVRYAVQALWRARHGDRLGEASAYRALTARAAAGLGHRDATHYLRRARLSALARGSVHDRIRTEDFARQLFLSPVASR